MNKVFKELFKFKLELFLLLITVIVSVIANLALPLLLADVINISIPNNDMYSIVKIGGNMLIFVLLGIVATVATGFFASIISVGLGKNLRSSVFKKVQFFSQTEFDDFSTSSLITRTNNDVLQVQNYINTLLKFAIMAPIMCVGGILLALEKSSSMSMILLISMPVMVVFILIVAKLATPLSIKMQAKLDDINLVTREKLTGIRVARAFGSEDFEEERFNKANTAYMKNAIKMNTSMGIIMPGLSFILYMTITALIAFSGYEIVNLNTNIPIGDMVAVVQYVMQIMMSVMMLSIVFALYPRAAVSAGRMKEVIETSLVIVDKENPVKETTLKGYISFKDVSFTFPNAKAPSLENITFDSGPGEVTAIIGSTGCGKSTLINLIPRFYDIQQGEILIDGVSIKDLDIKVLRSKIGLVPQKAFLFKGTIAENVSYGMEQASEDEIEHAIKIAQSYDFVMAKDGGFEAQIAQGGTNVSGGQRQRLAIARAITRKPEIYIFDDSFSALDFKTDIALRKALLQEAKEATVILVAQRVSTIMNADRIIVLENGQTVGIGKHEDLLRTCSVYQEIVYSQLNKEEV